jgi:hypothetical protein
MALRKSIDPYKQILASLLTDVKRVTREVITPSAYRRTIQKIEKRCAAEGLGFLTKTLPALGKAVDKTLAGIGYLDAAELRLATLPDSKLPKLFGELFKMVYSSDGQVLQSPCVTCIKAIRQLCFVFYKLKLEYAPELEQKVLSQFVKTEDEISVYHQMFSSLADTIDEHGMNAVQPLMGDEAYAIVRRARDLLARVFLSFDTDSIVPRHGPGVVSTKERLWNKFRFTRLNPRIQQSYPFDAFYRASVGHLCDTLSEVNSLTIEDAPAKVLLVPKDSRGPRLISCEPLEFQWIQQGLGRAIVDWVERHPLTRDHVHFTDQQPNQFGALLGSSTGKYATLDLKEASDRVTVGLVRLLFPQNVANVLLDCRSSATVLPDGQKLTLKKFAPMGSALCFPTLALTIWAILTGSATDAETRDSLLVYGDDVIVPTAKAVNAIRTLESFGLQVNRDKSCYQGSFRESCGVDAYKGYNITPVRIKDCWSSRPRAGVYESYLEQSRNFYKLGYLETSRVISSWIVKTYGRGVPVAELGLPGNALIETPDGYLFPRERFNKRLQRREYKVLSVETPRITSPKSGWENLLRYFTEGCTSKTDTDTWEHQQKLNQRLPVSLYSDQKSVWEFSESLSSSLYTQRNTSHLVLRWRG